VAHSIPSVVDGRSADQEARCYYQHPPLVSMLS